MPVHFSKENRLKNGHPLEKYSLEELKVEFNRLTGETIQSLLIILSQEESVDLVRNFSILHANNVGAPSGQVLTEIAPSAAGSSGPCTGNGDGAANLEDRLKGLEQNVSVLKSKSGEQKVDDAIRQISLVNMIPLIDLQSYNILVTEESVETASLKVIADQICQAFQEVGFVYLKNHGIPRELITNALSTSKTFFDQPKEKKQQYALQPGRLHGWIAFEAERVNHERPVFDAREGFTMQLVDRKDQTLPEKLPPEVDLAWKQLHNSCLQLGLHILDLLSIGLGKNKDYLRQCHQKIGLEDNCTMLRANYYPPLKEIKPEQARCGEHSDYGTVTFLFQDEVSGLQAKVQDGDYVPVHPIEDTIVMNLGDMMQRWSADRLKATKHRVMALPTDMHQLRQSIAFFVVPDNNALISCTDGSNKYPDIICENYVKSNFSANFQDDTEN